MLKKHIFTLSLATIMAANLHAQVAADGVNYDTTKYEILNEVVVSGVRVQNDAPFAVTNIKKVELSEFSKTGQELPFLFAKTPGILAWSENGVGTGTSYMRIRGSGDSRINVTLDGVSLNSPEDQCVFWANMNSYSSLLSSVQIQRGVGSSTNGDGAFGGTIALSTATPSYVPSAEITGSYGSFNTLNFGVKASTGMLWSSSMALTTKPAPTASSTAPRDAAVVSMAASPIIIRTSNSAIRTLATLSGLVRLGTAWWRATTT